MGLGKYFGERNHAYKFTIIEIYETILEYTKANFNDELLLQLIAIDYYTNQKSKPKDLFEFELNKKATEIFKEANEIETKDRLVLLPISFDWKVWNSDLKIIESNEMFALYYPGNTLPKIESIQNYKVEIRT